MSPNAPAVPQRSADVLSDDIVASLFGAGLALDRLVDRLRGADDQQLLDVVVEHLNNGIRDLRLMLCAIDDGSRLSWTGPECGPGAGTGR